MSNIPENSRVSTNWLEKVPAVFELFLPAIVTTFGLQSIRVLVPSLTWTLGHRLDMNHSLLVIIVLGIFLFTFLAGFFKKSLGFRRGIIITASCLGIFRCLLQFVWIEPLVNTVFSMLATISFLLFISIYIEGIRSSGKSSHGLFALGFLLGLSLDTGLHGVYGTYDLAWNIDFWSVLITLLLTTVLFFLLYQGKNLINVEDNQNTNPSFSQALPLISIGSFLFLQLQVFQNIARLTVTTGWEPPIAFSWVMLGHLLGITFSVWLLFRPPVYKRAIAYLLCIILILSVIFPEPTGLLAGTYFILGQIAASILILFIIINSIGPSRHQKIHSGHNTPISLGIGSLIMMLLILGYYASYLIAIPFENHIYEPLAAFVIVACVIPLNLRELAPSSYNTKFWLAPAITILLLLLSFANMITFQKPVYSTDDSSTDIRIMCYNLHNGFDTKGYLGLEALASNIEAFEPDIVALQEISRGWLISGRVDMAEWLSLRLDMPYIYGDTAGTMWGNVILSRFEITEYHNESLPSEGLPVKRGFTHAVIETSNDQTVNVIATHFHHVESDSDIRQTQAETLFAYTSNLENVIIMGDLNTAPETPVIQMFASAGFIDVLSLIEPPPAYTYHADNPDIRIDYILISPNMEASQIEVHQSTASDHFAISAIIQP
jgi:endonuclease/exonuclease/phosphatase family metal-dependent hydrolase/MFS family permease